MLLALLLAAGPALQHHAPPATMEGRVNLLEARQMLEAQQLWSIRAELPPEALKALGDLELHVQHDQEQEDRVRDLSQTVQLLTARLTALELLLQDKGALESAGRIPVSPMELQALEMPARKPDARKSKASSKKTLAKRKPAKARAQVAEVP